VLEVVHDGALDLHRAVVPEALGDELLQEALDQTTFRIVPQVPGIGPRLVVDEFELSHQPDVRRFLLRFPRLRHLVRREPPEPVVALEMETAHLAVLDREVMDGPVRLEDAPVRDELRLRLHRGGEVFLSFCACVGNDLAGEFTERMALHRHAEGLVVSEGGRVDVKAAGEQLPFQRGDQFLGGARRGEG